MTEELQWLVSNLNQQIDDVGLGEKNVEIDFYWDTATVISAILGMASFYRRGAFDRTLFQHKNTLVVALAAAGWLGPIRLLQPHQAELLNHLNSDFHIGNRTVPSGGKRQFFQEVGLQDLQQVDQIADLSSDKLRSLVQQQAGQAQTFFKALQFVGNWQSRLVSYVRGDAGTRLGLEKDDGFDVAKAMEGELFRVLRTHLDKAREGRSINNLIDAMAICYLQHLMNKFCRDETKHLPRFFLPGGALRDAIQSLEDKTLFCYTGADGRTRSVLLDADYYIFRATFNPPAKLVTGNKPSNSLDTLKHWLDAANEVLEAPKPLREVLIRRIQVEGRLLTDRMDDLKRFLFLKQVWLPYAAAQEFKKVVNDDLTTTLSLATNEQFIETVAAAVADTRKKLDRNASDIRQAARLWSELERCAELIRNRLRRGSPKEMDVFRTFGLLRFGVPETDHPQIQACISGLLSEDTERINQELIVVVAACHRARMSADVKSLAITLSVLWVLEMDHALQSLCSESASVLSSTWTKTVYAASLYRSPTSKLDPDPLLRQLEEGHSAAGDHLQKAKNGMGIAYLFFRRWQALGGVAFWQKHRAAESAERREEEIAESLRKAIAFAEEAACSKHIDERVTVYAMNQCLFYIAEAESAETFKKRSKGLAQALLEYRNEERLWQYRFDDTLARYFYRWSLEEPSPELKKEYLDMAKAHILKADADSYGDPLVGTFLSVVIGSTIPSID
ncbi:MAG TPA: hypothetical protein VJ723_05760 [Candidatus Angelobacter sp.]|nr:hypothetical protein [Candidatus Angelobacter sp.]